MSKMLVVVFDDETSAFEGSNALAELHRDGYISAYAGAIVARDADGALALKREVDAGPIGTALGMLTGSLVGLLAGPAGLVAGAALGGVMGATADLINTGVGVDFVNEVGEKLEPGKVAVVAEVSESWTVPVETRMEELGGVVIRRNRIDVEDQQIEREIQANKAEWEALKAELHASAEQNKAQLQQQLDTARAKLQQSGDRAERKLEQIESEGKAKAHAIEDQITKAKAENKAALETRLAALKADYAQRSGKLKQAWEITKEALAA